MGTYSSQIQGINLPAIYAAAQQYRANEQQMQQQAAERDRQDKLRTLYAGAMGGDQRAIQGLQRADPQGYLALQKTQLEQKGLQQDQLAKQAEQQRKQQDQAIENMTTIGNAMRFVASAPEDKKPTVYQGARNQLTQLGVIKPEDMAEQYDPAAVGSLLAQSEAMHRSIAAKNDTGDWQNYMHVRQQREAGGLPVISFEDYQRNQKRAGAMNIYNDMGNQNLTKEGQHKTEENIRESAGMLGTIHSLQQIFAPELLTVEGRAEIETLRRLASSSTLQKMRPLTAENKALLQKAAQFDQYIDDLGSMARKERLGTGQSATELKNSAMMIVNRSIDPESFPAVLQNVADRYEFMVAVDQQLRDDGVPKDSERYNQLMDNAVRQRDAARARQDQQQPQQQGQPRAGRQQSSANLPIGRPAKEHPNAQDIADYQARNPGQPVPGQEPADQVQQDSQGIRIPNPQGLKNNPTDLIAKGTQRAAALDAMKKPDGSKMYSDAQIHAILRNEGLAK